MSHAVCCVALAPVRSAPDHRSEMVSQILFGECVIITVTEKNGWIKMVHQKDAYTGWCRQAHFQEIDDAIYYSGENKITADWINAVDYNGRKMWVPFGSSLTAMKNGNLPWGSPGIHFKGNVWEPAAATPDAANIRLVAFKFLHTVYLWGGRSVFGIDCSGFTQAVYSFFNIPLLRDARQQATQGELVGFLQEAQCGDLAFFDDTEGQIVHTGILLNAQEIIHASDKVRIDKIDHEGIIDADTGQRTQRLRIIKRYIS